ncbi:hypothetical protein FQN54_004546 [Arachnomyces sp. PD_36]|nr:hypothetical protein FQN54_004546 [Arachnomyces sp. PD_36]
MSTDNTPVWLITGCSSGLGIALARKVLSNGYRVVVTARNPSSIPSLPDTNTLLKQPLDVTSKSSIKSAFAAALATFGRVDCVINNAGWGNFEEAEATPEDEARGLFEVNFWGSSNVALEAVRVFRDENPAGEGGFLIQISSLVGRVGSAGQAYYSSSKFAIEGFTESLSKELHPDWNIKVLIAEPGAIGSTSFTKNLVSPRDIHPAYKQPGGPTLKVREWLASPTLEDGFPSNTAMAATLFDAVTKGGLPLRLPLGQDSWEAIEKSVSQTVEDLERFRDVSERPAKDTAEDNGHGEPV